MLSSIARQEDLCRSTLGHIKHFLSGVFRYAGRQGVLDSPNPMREVEIPRARPADVKQSVWRNQVGEPKREKSKGAIPVIAQLKLFLDRHRASSGNPPEGFIFRNLWGNALNLDALVGEVIQPALEAERIPWYGWHAFRRGLATNLHRLGVSDKVIQQILRHTNVTTTINIYVKMVTQDAEEAMKKLETKCVAVGTQVSQRPPHRTARAGFLHAAPTADVWRRSANSDTDEGFWG
jgi:Phage integrase family